MDKISLSNQLSLSPIVQGFWRLDSWKLSTEQLTRFMSQCIDRGVTSFDTAEIYADSLCEKLMGDAFQSNKSLRNRIEVISKTGIFSKTINGQRFGYYNTTKKQIKISCKESLSRLKTDYIDLYLIHREDPCINPWDTGEALLELQREGYIKEFGVSNFDPIKFSALNSVVNDNLVTNQIELNPLCFEHFNSGMIDLLISKRIHPMIWSPLAGGKLFAKNNALSQRAMNKIKEIATRHNVEPETIIYAWLLYHPVKAIPISGSSKLERLDLAIRALQIRLEHYEWYEIYCASGQQVLR